MNIFERIFLLFCCELCVASSNYFYPLEDLSWKVSDTFVYFGGHQGTGFANFYNVGAVWMREEDGVQYLYHVPDDNSLGFCVRVPFDLVCEQYSLDAKSDDVKKMLSCAASPALSENAYPSTPSADIACAFAEFVKEVALVQKTQEVFWDGRLHPVFDSWARHDSICEEDSSDRVLCLEPARMRGYNFGAVWAQRLKGRVVLCYRPENAASHFLCYRCDLHSAVAHWPKNWNSVLDIVVDFAFDTHRKDLTEILPPGQADFVTLVVKAVLCGRGASFDKPVWFAWRPCRSYDGARVVDSGDKILFGNRSEGQFVHALDSAWMRGRKGRRAVFYCSRQGLVFRYFPAAEHKPSLCDKLLCTEADLDVSWEKVVCGFILGGLCATPKCEGNTDI